MSNNEYKKYLIDSIIQMEDFCAKLETKINETDNGRCYGAMSGIYSRKKESILQFKLLLASIE